jgi:hypothetical protein
MAARLFGGGCLTPDQESAVGIPVKDYSCSVANVNTCGISAEELLLQYPLYDPQPGRLVTAWGDINVPWSAEPPGSDVRWQEAKYRRDFSYREGDRVIYLENEGYTLVLYEALGDIPAVPGLFDYTKWEKICEIKVSTLVGLPSYSELLSKYQYYSPDVFLTEWGEFSSQWSANLENPDSDEWGKAVIKKTFIYNSGDIVLYDTACGNFTCLYVSTRDIPNTVSLLPDQPPPAEYWRRLFCVENGKPYKCSKRFTCDGKSGREIVSLSSGDSDLICVPVESSTGIGPRR